MAGVGAMFSTTGGAWITAGAGARYSKTGTTERITAGAGEMYSTAGAGGAPLLRFT